VHAHLHRLLLERFLKSAVRAYPPESGLAGKSAQLQLGPECRVPKVPQELWVILGERSGKGTGFDPDAEHTKHWTKWDGSSVPAPWDGFWRLTSAHTSNSRGSFLRGALCALHCRRRQPLPTTFRRGAAVERLQHGNGFFGRLRSSLSCRTILSRSTIRRIVACSLGLISLLPPQPLSQLHCGLWDISRFFPERRKEEGTRRLVLPTPETPWTTGTHRWCCSVPMVPAVPMLGNDGWVQGN
jgi:hypothetical protein